MIFITSIFISTAAAAPSVESVLDKVDELYRSRSASVRVAMHIRNPGFERNLELEMWSEGKDKTFITILSPTKDKGVSTLRIGKEMWNYFPAINKVMTVPPSMMTASWMGSDFTNDDLVRETSLRNDYEARMTPTDNRLVLDLKPKASTVSVWGRIELTVRADDLLPVRERFFDEKGNEKRVMHFEEVKTLGGRNLPTVMRIENLAKPGQQTTITYKEAKFDTPNPPDTFTLRNLQRRR